jgi:hypothetical protein
VSCGARKQQQQMDPGRGCPAQIPDRGQYVGPFYCSGVEKVGQCRKGARSVTEHIDETGTGRDQGLASKMDKVLIARKLKRTVIAINTRLKVLRGKTK